MEFNHKKGGMCRRLMPLAFVVGLSACGDNGGSAPAAGGGKSGASSGSAQTGAGAGRLLDGAVEGVAYVAPGGSGTTDGNGAFNFNYGDTVEFKLGGLSLGKAKGAAIVTPIELAGGSEKRLPNLLVLLQSLDADGDPGNGISIPAAAASALDAALDLEGDPSALAASPALQKARDAAGIAGPARTPEEASAHFLAQAVGWFGTHIWIRQDDTATSVIRFSRDGTGEYLAGDATPDDSCDTNRVCGGSLVSTAGVEYGTLKFTEADTRGFKVAAQLAIDTNRHAGLSHPRPNWRIRSDGEDLIASDIFTVQREREQKSLFGELFHIAGTLEISSEHEEIKTEVKENRYARLENDPKGIVGAWASDPAAIKTPLYVFLPSGKYMLIDPVGDVAAAGRESCGGPGVEFASYTHDAGGALTIRSFTYDTNGCAGFSGKEADAFRLGGDGNTATLVAKDGTSLTLHRVSR